MTSRRSRITSGGFRLADVQGRPVAPSFTDPHPEESIAGREFRRLHRTTQNAELASKGEILQMEHVSRFEGRQRRDSQHVKRAVRQTEELREHTSSMFSFKSRFPIGSNRNRARFQMAPMNAASVLSMGSILALSVREA